MKDETRRTRKRNGDRFTPLLFRTMMSLLLSTLESSRARNLHMNVIARDSTAIDGDEKQ